MIDQKRIEWPKGSVEQSLDLVLPRRVLIHGKVTEEGSGEPIPGALVNFMFRRERQRRIAVRADNVGSYQIGVVASTGHLVVRGPTDNYVLRGIADQTLQPNSPSDLQDYVRTPSDRSN